jgi:hypothetical protein
MFSWKTPINQPRNNNVTTNNQPSSSNDGGIRGQRELLGVKNDILNVKSDVLNVKGSVVDVRGDVVDVKSDIVDVKSLVLDVKSQVLDIKNSNTGGGNSSQNNITIDEVVDSLNAFKTSIYRAAYINDLIEQNQDKIRQHGYDATLSPIYKSKFLGEENYFALVEVPTNFDYNNTLFLSTHKEFDFLIGTHANETKNTPKYPNLNTLVTEQRKQLVDVLQKFIKDSPNSAFYNTVAIRKWVNGYKIYSYIFRKSVTDNTKWIFTLSGVDLKSFLPNAGNNNVALSSDYLKFAEAMSAVFEELNAYSYSPDSAMDVWEFGNPLNFASLKCVQSVTYPSFTGQPMSQCFIPGSNENLPKTLLNIVTDLFQNYPTLYDGQLAITTYQLDNINYVAIVKMVTIGTTKCFVQKQLNIESFFTKQVINLVGDSVIHGSFDVLNYKNEPIIKSDNINKIMCFHDKVGINQEPFEVEGLMDIDCLSNNNMILVMNDIKTLSLNNHSILNQINLLPNLNPYVLSNLQSNIQNTPLNEFKSQFLIFKVPNSKNITESDVQFVYKPLGVNIFASNAFKNGTFDTIDQITNEIYRMKDELKNNVSKTLSFVELLADDDYTYIVSMSCIMMSNDLYFITTFKSAETYIDDLSYKKKYTQIIGTFGKLNRLLNYGALLLYNESIFAKLKNNDITEFVNHINNGEFRNRLGLRYSPYFTCWNISDNYTDLSSIKFLLHEVYPYWAGRDVLNLYIKGTDFNASEIINSMLTSYNNTYDIKSLNNNFLVNYDFTNGTKVSFVTIIDVNGTKYMMGTGLNLADHIDKGIVTRADNLLLGDFLVKDELNRDMFHIDPINNNINSMCKIGICTTDPKSMLDIRDTSITDILRYGSSIFAYAAQKNKFIDHFKNLDLSKVNIKKEIESFFPNQTTEKYIAIAQFNEDSHHGGDDKMIYNWLIPRFAEFSTLKEVNDANIVELKNTLILVHTDLKQNYKLFSGIEHIYQNNWVNGVKRTRHYFIRNNIDKKLYRVSEGSNLGSFDIKVNRNKSIQEFFTACTASRLNLNEIIQKITNPSIVLNNIKGAETVRKNMLKYPITKFTVYTLDNNSLITDSCVEEYDYNAFVTTPFVGFNGPDPSTKIKNLPIQTPEGRNYRSKHESCLLCISKNYNVNEIGNGHMLSAIFEDLHKDFSGLVYVYKNGSNGPLKLIMIETCITDYIKPALNVDGDIKCNSDLIVYDKYNKLQYCSIDPDNKFVGINTDERFINYANIYTTASNSAVLNNVQQQHVYIKNDKYPNLVCERVAERSDGSDVKNKDYSLFKTYSASTMKRKSNLYLFSEMYENATKNNSRYGGDISFEMCDSTNRTQEIGNIHMVIDSVDNRNIIRGGFGVGVADTNVENKVVYRPIMYVDNASTLHVSNIVVGNKKGVSNKNIADNTHAPDSNMSVDTIKLAGSEFPLTVATYTNKRGNITEKLMWGEMMIAKQERKNPHHCD